MNDRDWIEHRLVPGVRAISTLRGGVACDCGSVDGTDRAALAEVLGTSVQLHWMQQVHGTRCVDLDIEDTAAVPTADAACTRRPGQAAVVLTADCLPVLLASRDGAVVAAIHAGWRGLAAGVIATAVRQMGVDPATLVGVFGPAIGQEAFEVGSEVRDAFVHGDRSAAVAFRPGRADRWHADLYMLAQQQLSRIGVPPPHHPDWCTRSEARFHSWRRDGQAAGRMAHLVWRVPADGRKPAGNPCADRPQGSVLS
jgi:YfiH family protein